MSSDCLSRESHSTDELHFHHLVATQSSQRPLNMDTLMSALDEITIYYPLLKSRTNELGVCLQDMRPADKAAEDVFSYYFVIVYTANEMLTVKYLIYGIIQ